MKPERKRLGGWQRKLAKLTQELETAKRLIEVLEEELVAKTAIIRKLEMEKKCQTLIPFKK